MITKTMSVTGRLIETFAAAWAAIQKRHGDVPDVVITLASGTEQKNRARHGHFQASTWVSSAVDAEGAVAELFVSGEGLSRPAREVFGTLVHEAAHGVAHTREVQDTSRQGRYHNRKFAELAAELGIVVAPDGARGWSATTLPDETAAVYVAELAGLAEAITAYRSAEATGPGTTTSRNNPPATCGCEPARRIRVARSVLSAGPIVCGVCEAEFTVDEPDDADGDVGGEADVDAYGEEVA